LVLAGSRFIRLALYKGFAFGPIAGQKDLSGRGVSPTISDEYKAWVIHLASRSPGDYGYAVYKEIQLTNILEEEKRSNFLRKHTTVSYYEKQWIQAMKNIDLQLLYVPGKHNKAWLGFMNTKDWEQYLSLPALICTTAR